MYRIRDVLYMMRDSGTANPGALEIILQILSVILCNRNNLAVRLRRQLESKAIYYIFGVFIHQGRQRQLKVRQMKDSRGNCGWIAGVTPSVAQYRPISSRHRSLVPDSPLGIYTRFDGL